MNVIDALKLKLAAARLALYAWDEAKHPRHPSGDEQGGEFAPSGDGEIKDKNGVVFDVKHSTRKDEDGTIRHTYDVIPKGAPWGVTAGTVTLGRNAKRVMWVGIHKEYQRKGLASALYLHIEKHLGYPLEPNWAQTPEGDAFWASRGPGKKQ